MLRYPVSAFIEITERCNLRCIHCYNNSGLCNSDIDFDILKKLIDDFEKNGVFALTISGGEPLLYPRIKDLLYYIRSNSSIHIALNTNGILLDNEEYISLLLENQIKTIQVSLDGNKDTHDLIRGNGTYETTINAIRNCISHGIDVRIGYTVNAMNYKQIEEVSATAKKIGASSIALYRYIPNSERNGHQLLDFDAKTLYEAAKTIINVKTKYNSQIFNLYFEKLSFYMFLLDEKFCDCTHCLAGKGQINIDSNCRMSLCAHLHNALFDLRKSDVSTAWNMQNDLMQLLDEIPEECVKCSFASLCKGGCKGISYALTKTFRCKDRSCYKDYIENKIGVT